MLIFFIPVLSYGQSNYVQKSLLLTTQKASFDSVSIAMRDFMILSKTNQIIDDSLYSIDFVKAIIEWKGELPVEVTVRYRILSFDFSTVYTHKDSSLLRSKDSLQFKNPYLFSAKNGNSSDLFQSSGINRTGSVSRGVLFGNNQNLSVNSTLNLQLSGKISEDIEILASISDDNIPIQPAGNTQQLQDFDQVYIQLFSKDWKLTAGDFWLKRPQSYFLNYNKRAQGASYEWRKMDFSERADTSFFSTRLSLAVSKGKFARNVLQGIENNQGPYRLKGAENEPFIIVLSGTEIVYIDGEMLKRGQENDYIIDYNTAEITFTSNRMITKDKRIVVEFQYSDKNYARSIIESSNKFTYNKWDFSLNIFSEQDAKNQPLQQELNDADKEILFNAGDNPLLMLSNGVDSVGQDNNSVLYKALDTLGYAIYQYSTDVNAAYYKIIFSDVGAGNGNYIQLENSPFGRVYGWVAPDTVAGQLVKNGRYEPVKVLISPKKRQMVTLGVGRKLNENWTTNVEIALSNYDANTFSTLDAADNQGLGIKYNLIGKKKFTANKIWNNSLQIETVAKNFQQIERFRDVEFTRNWNAPNLPLGDQYIGSYQTQFSTKGGSLRYGVNGFVQPDVYQGLKQEYTIQSSQFLETNIMGSYLRSSGAINSRFYRHKASVKKELSNTFQLGYLDEVEINRFEQGDSLAFGSYAFYDYQFFIANADSTINRFKLFYRERIDLGLFQNELTQAARALNPGLEVSLIKSTNNQFIFRTNYRKLTINPNVASTQQPDNTLLNRVEYRARWLNGGITSNFFYEFGSGLELRREFAYIEVPAGQGIYYWVDYNDNGIKELDEFEIAQFPDQAIYIRVTTPSSSYIKVFSTQVSEVLAINPKSFLTSKSKWIGFINRFNLQTSLRTERKTTLEDVWDNLNPFLITIPDSSLQSINNSMRQSVFFNRINPKFGLEYTYLQLNTKSLLFTGFDERNRVQHEYKLRYNFDNSNTVLVTVEQEQKYNKSDFAPSRTYDLDIVNYGLKWIYQPTTFVRVALNGNYKEKQNDPVLSNDQLYMTEFGIEGKFNKLKKGTINLQVKYININYNGETYSPLAYEMLESLQNGNNMTWTASFQQNFANNLQLTINYSGRKSQDNPTVRIGGVQLRAFF